MLGTLSASHLSLFVALAVAVAVLAFAWRKPIPELGRNSVIAALAIWAAAASVEFWALGPRSFVMLNDEGEFSFPLYLYQARWLLDGGFAHGIAGGVGSDLLYGQQPIGLEKLLFALFPGWLALALQKTLVLSVGASGAYLLVRGQGGCGRAAALALAMLFTLAHRYSLTVTLTHGLGYALIPWAAHVIVGRLGRRRYWLGVAALAAIHAASCSPTHSLMALGAAPLVLWAAKGFPRPAAVLAASGLTAAATIANWAPVLMAMASHGAESYRAAAGLDKSGDLVTLVLSVLRQPEISALFILSMAALIRVRAPGGWRAALALGLILAVPTAVFYFPWEVVGLPILNGIDFTYIGLALSTVALPFAGMAARPEVTGPWARRLSLLTIALAAMVFVNHKVWHGIQWIGMGGQSLTVTYETLRQRPWAPTDHPFRVVSVPYRLEANTVASYGLETFDGLTNVLPKAKVEFWINALNNPNPGVVPGYLYIAHHAAMDFLCCDSYPVEAVGPLAALRLGNVEFILSLLPLSGEGIALVSGPVDGWVPPRRGDAFPVKLGKLWRMLTGTTPVYVYAVAGALPRAHGARAVVVDDGARDKAWHARVIRQALEGAAVVSAADSARLPAAAPVAVTAARLAPGGYSITLEAPKGGVLLVNQVHSRHWTAMVDGVEAPPVPANAVEMAIALPAGAKEVTLRMRGGSRHGS